MNVIICLAVFFPIVCGLLILFFPGLKKRKELLFVSLLSLVVSMLYALAVIAGGEAELHLLRFGGSLEVFSCGSAGEAVCCGHHGCVADGRDFFL